MQTAAKSVEIAESSWEESVSAWMDGEDSDDILPSLLSKDCLLYTSDAADE